MLVGLIALLLYMIGRFTADPRLGTGPQPIRKVLWLYFAAVLAAYAAGEARPLDSIERGGADRALVLFLSIFGACLLALDGLRSRRSLDRVLSWLLSGAYFSAVVGVLQFRAGFDLAARLQLPGFVLNGDLFSHDRSIFHRASGTSLHAIEFGVVLAACLPLAYHFWRFAESASGRRWHGFGFWSMAVAAPMSVSRSAVIGLAVALGVYIAPWPWRRKGHALILAAIGVVGLRVAVPGLVGTLKSSFINVNNDPSISGRTSDYDAVNFFASQRPWLGRGFGTFRPEEFRLLDNQYLGTMVEGGVVLLLMMLVLFIAGSATAREARRLDASATTRSLGQALAAGISVFAVSAAFYDEFSFRQSVTLLFFFVACSGVLWRLSREQTTSWPECDEAV